jgi:VWFA-related protein
VAALLSLLAIQTATAQQVTPAFQASGKLALVPVVVRDRDGRPVTGLDQTIFRVFDNGKPQTITSFSIEQGGAGQAPDHFTAYFFDDVSFNDLGAVAALRDAALHNLANLQPGDRVAILSSSCRLAQDFTDDRSKLAQVVAQFQPSPIPACQVAKTLPLQIVLLQSLVRRMALLPGARSIIVISAGFRVPNDRQDMRDQLIDEAVRAKVAIQAIHASGNFRQGMGAATRRPKGLEDNDSGRGSTDPGNLFAIAEGTGGADIEATNAADVAFRQVATPTCIYVLGFVPEGNADGKYHKLKVTLTDARKLSVRARRGYYVAESPAAAAVERGSAPPKPASELPERSTSKEPVMFRSRTSLVLVPVVVRDKNGQAVGNLQKHDFQLSDRGKRQEITSFAEEKTERAHSPRAAEAIVATPSAPATAKASPAVIPDGFLAYVFDDVHMRFGDMKWVREAVWQNISETLQAADRVAVVTTSGRVMLDFTDDREKIHAALYRIQPTPVFRAVCGANVALIACPDKLSYLHAYKVMTGDRVALDRAVSLVTANPASPNASRLGGPARNLPSDSPLEMRAEMAANAPLNAGERETELSLHTLRDLSRRMASLAGRRTIVLLSHGFLVTDTLQDELAESIDRAIRSGVVIHTLNSSGLLGPGGGGSPWDDDTVGPNGTSPYAHEAQLDGAMTLVDMAEATGGTAIENSNDYLAGIRRLAAPPEYRYVLGFAPQDLVANGSFHRLTIKLEHKGYTIQARRGYYAPKRSEGLTEATAKEIENEVFARDELHDLSVELRTEVSAAELTVLADLDLKSLHFRQADGRNNDDVTVVAVVFDHNGNFIAGKQQLLKLSLFDQTVANLDRQPTETLKSTFDLSPGAYLVRLVVRSAEGETMAAVSRSVEIP